MKAITIKQPWASLICHGIKDIENRTWKCPKKYIGQRVLIHASSKHLSMHQLVNILSEPQKEIFQIYDFNKTWLESLSQSCIIGSIVIADCVQNHPSVWAEKGCWNWVLEDPVLFDKTYKIKGKLGFWNIPEDIEVLNNPFFTGMEINKIVYDAFKSTQPFDISKCRRIINNKED